MRTGSAANASARAPRERAVVTTDGIGLTPYAGANRIRFYGTLSACARRGQAPRSKEKSKEGGKRASVPGWPGTAASAVRRPGAAPALRCGRFVVVPNALDVSRRQVHR